MPDAPATMDACGDGCPGCSVCRQASATPPESAPVPPIDPEFVRLVDDVLAAYHTALLFGGEEGGEAVRYYADARAALWSYLQHREARARAEGEAMRGALERCADAWHSAHLGFENGPCRCPAHEIALAALLVPDETRET